MRAQVKGIYPYLFSVCMLLLGCTMVERAADKQNAGSILEIRQGTAYPFSRELRIGLNYVHRSEYVDENGLKKYGLVATIVLFLEPYDALNNDLKDRSIEVHVGQRIQWGGFSIYIEELNIWLKSIRLRVEKLDPPK